MINRILSLIFLVVLLATVELSAQEELPNIPNADLIKGKAFVSYPDYSGSPWLNPNFQMGEIEFTDGMKVANIGLRYSSYRDDLVYYNTWLQAQIIVDKVSLKGFSIIGENGVKRVFRHQYFDNYENGDRYFEVLSDGEVSLLVYRKVNLETANLANVKRGMEYLPTYYYYMFSDKKGYVPLNITRNSLLSVFSPANQKLAKKLLRRNRVTVTDEVSFVLAWNLLKVNGIKAGY
ncbi:MAG: hypothetical protein WCP85_04750 [Mariniphaga sp.]